MFPRGMFPGGMFPGGLFPPETLGVPIGLGVYNIYQNDGIGGPVDYGLLIATTRLTTWTTPALAPGSSWEFAVRAYDAAVNLEEQNLDARVFVRIDPTGVDVSGRPGPPTGLAARPTAAGGVAIRWNWWPAPGTSLAALGGLPTGFKVWCQASGSGGVPGTINYSLAPTVITPSAGRGAYSAAVAGLADGVTYTIGVRATNASGDDLNTLVVGVVAVATPPASVDMLTATIGNVPS